MHNYAVAANNMQAYTYPRENAGPHFYVPDSQKKTSVGPAGG